MSVKVVHEEIRRFLENSASEVLCLKGKWGVGKTYAWNRYLQDVTNAGKLAFDKYSYVSLFGLNSLEDVKYALFEGTVASGDLKDGPTEDTVEKAYGWVRKNYRKGVSLLTKNPLVKSYLGETERSLFFLVRKQIVCIDDLERAGSGLSTKDVFGLISYLKEQRGCKIALLLNDEKLLDKAVFNELLEKVIDTKLDFSPTPQEAADIVFPSPEGVRKLIHKNSITLGITNIRVIKKIERIVMRFEEIFGRDSVLMTQVAHSSTLFGWSVYQPDEAPTIDFLKDFGRMHGLSEDKEKTPENERGWQELIRVYEYSNSDEFDLKILETIQNGYFDTDKLNLVAEKQIKNVDEINTKKKFEDAWNLYHDSFNNNEGKVLEAIYSSAKKGAVFIDPMNIDSTVAFLREFGKEKEASDLIKHYVEVRSNEKELFNFENSLFSRDMKDPELIDAFKKQRETINDSRDPAQVLVDIYMNHGWNPEDITLVSKLTPNDFYEKFKGNSGIKLHQLIKGSLDFGKVGNASDDIKNITKNATEALERIGKETKLNARRVATHGIKVNDTD
jgi:hypothetical protein